MTMHFRPPVVGLPNRRTAIAAAGATCLVAAIAAGGYNLASNLEYLHHGYTWACASLPSADPSVIAESFYGGAEDKALTIAASAQCAMSELANNTQEGAANAARLLLDATSLKFAELQEGYESMRAATAAARGTVGQSLSNLATRVGTQVSDFASLPPAEMASQAKKIAANALELFLAVKAVKVGYKAATSWFRRKIRRTPAVSRLAGISEQTAVQATNVTINVTIAAGSGSPEDVKKNITDHVARLRAASGPEREQSAVDVMDAVLEAVEEGGTIIDGMQDQLLDITAAAIEQTGQPEIPRAIAETIAQGFTSCENACEKVALLEVDL